MEGPVRVDTGDVDVFLGLDVGKGEHHATAVTFKPSMERY